MSSPDSRLISFLFTDIEASTRRWERDAVAMSAALARHDAVVREAIGASGGTVLKHTGDGFVAVFEQPAGALRAAVAIQRTLGESDARVRAGLHTGAAELRDGDYFGSTLNRAARIMALGSGGHVLVSSVSATIIGTETPEGTRLLDLGEHLLKDFEQPERIFQAVGSGLVSDRAVAERQATPARGGRSTFVGRAKEVAELDAMLERERCVTITGIGGSGKTRLALEVASRGEARYSDGVSVVELAPIADPREVPRAVADSVGMPVVSDSVGGDLAIFLRGRDCLVVLDNCEHLLDACADLADELIGACPNVSILATSREALGIDGERSWRAPSLTLPSESLDADPLDCESAALFVARAVAARPDFAASGHRAAIAEICRRLDGLPLAIELAAARAGHLSVEQISAMLDDRFRLLTGGARRARQRQQTLQAAMDWSYELLSDDDKRVLRQLSVFSGGWSLEAAIAVCGRGDAVAIIDALGSLCAKSLVTAGDVASGLRYGMLETVRLYAQERLVESGEAEQLRDHHRDWVTQFIKECEDSSGVIQFYEASQRVEPELENLRAALDWSREQDRGELITTLISKTWPTWYVGLRSFEALNWLDTYAPPADAILPAAVRVEWRIARGFLLQESMNGAEIARCGAEALALDPDGQASPFTGLGWFLQMMLPLVMNPPEAMRIANQAIEWLGIHRNDDVADMTRSYVANVLIANDEFAAARELLADIIDRGSFNDYLLQWVQTVLATIDHVLGDDDRAVAQLQATISTLGVSPGRHIDMATQALLAIAETARGNRTESRTALKASATCVRRRYGHIPSAWGGPVTAAAIVLAIEGRDDEALQLMVAVGAQRRLWQARQESMFVLHKRYGRQLAERMSAEAFTRAWVAGEQMTPEDMCERVDALAAET